MADDDSTKDERRIIHNVLEEFGVFQGILDTKYDLHEKVVKLSRDITIASKRIIFALHRTTGNTEDGLKTIKEAKEDLEKSVLPKFKQIVHLLKDVDPIQFLRAYSPGLQEYIEASAFHHFLSTHNNSDVENIESCILTREEIQKLLTFDIDGMEVYLPVPVEEYLLGLSDVTGECMRMCINRSAESLGQATMQESMSFKLCSFVQGLHNAFHIFVEMLDVSAGMRKQFGDKLRTMDANVKKCEDVCYMLRIRGHEIPKSLLKSTLTAPVETG